MAVHLLVACVGTEVFSAQNKCRALDSSMKAAKPWGESILSLQVCAFATIRLPMPISSSRKLTLMTSPDYWAEACAQLMERDLVLRRLIPLYGQDCMQSRGDAFSTLARSVVGQQISVKAAQAVWDRFIATLPRRRKLSPANVLKLKVDDMRAAGLSARKIEYLVDLALHFDREQLNVQSWPQMEDEAIIAELVGIRGIGRWTAEMFLMFYLLRPDVLPLDDAGLIKGISHNYFSGEPVSRSDAREIARAWGPWRSVGTWYMWRSLDPVPVCY